MGGVSRRSGQGVVYLLSHEIFMNCLSILLGELVWLVDGFQGEKGLNYGEVAREWFYPFLS